MSLARVRDLLIEIASLAPGDVAGFGNIGIFDEEARELIEAIETYETMLELTKAGQMNPMLLRLLRDKSTVETLQVIAKQRAEDGGV